MLVMAVMLCILCPSVHSVCHLRCTGGRCQVMAHKWQVAAKRIYWHFSGSTAFFIFSVVFISCQWWAISAASNWHHRLYWAVVRRDLLNNYRVKSLSQILAFVHQRLVEWSMPKAQPLRAGCDWLLMLEIVFMMLFLVIKNKNKTGLCHNHAVWSGQNLYEQIRERRNWQFWFIFIVVLPTLITAARSKWKTGWIFFFGGFLQWGWVFLDWNFSE